MNRRDFVKFLALTAAGAAALPQQIAAFEQYYEANTPQADSGMVAVDEIFISGQAWKSIPALVSMPPLTGLGLNLFGGILLWRAPFDGKIIRLAQDVCWTISGTAPKDVEPDMFTGHISYIDQDAKRHYRPITLAGNLADA